MEEQSAELVAGLRGVLTTAEAVPPITKTSVSDETSRRMQIGSDEAGRTDGVTRRRSNNERSPFELTFENRRIASTPDGTYLRSL